MRRSPELHPDTVRTGMCTARPATGAAPPQPAPTAPSPPPPTTTPPRIPSSFGPYGIPVNLLLLLHVAVECHRHGDVVEVVTVGDQAGGGRARGGNRGLGFRFSGRAGDLKLGRIAISDQAYYIIKYYFYYKLRMGFSQNSIE